MGRIIPFFFLVDLALMVIALIDCLSAEEGSLRALPKIVWVFIILLFSPVGPIVYLVAGRPQQVSANRGHRWSPGAGFPEYDRPSGGRPYSGAPDDDPEFLADLARRVRDDDRLYERWESDLRKREEDLRKREEERRQEERKDDR